LCGYSIAEVEVKPAQRSQKPIKIYLYKKADWSQMAVEMSRVSEEMESHQHSKSTNELRMTFKSAMSDAMDKYIQYLQRFVKAGNNYHI